MLKNRSLLQRWLVYWNPNKTNSSRYVSKYHYKNIVRNFPPIEKSQLANGLTVVTQNRKSVNTCIGLYVNAGSRYESKEENGITHFFEHIAFKGTKAKTKTVLKNMILATGAKFQCFTTREMAVYDVECLSEDFPHIFDIFLDCIFNNAFTFEEIEAEKKTVWLEMMEEDKIYNKILFDYLHLSAFQGNSLAQTVMGPSDNLRKFNSKMLCNLLYKRFIPGNMVLTAIGNVNHDQVLELANNYLKNIKCVERDDIKEERFTGSDMRYRDDSLPMAHVAIAFEGPSFCHDDYNVMKLAQMVVGGWDKSQLGGLNHGTRVARNASYNNLCDSYKSFNISYKDTALWGAHFVASKLSLDDMTYMLQEEWLRLCTMITDEELEMARNQLKTKLFVIAESALQFSHQVGRSILYRKCHLPIFEAINTIDKMTSKDVQTICYKYLYDKCPVVTAIGPVEKLTDYARIRSGTYWLRL